MSYVLQKVQPKVRGKVRNVVNPDSGGGGPRYVFLFNGTNQAVDTGRKIIANPTTDDFAVSCTLYSPIGLTGVLFSQTVQGNNALQEFRVFLNPDMRIVVGGVVTITGYSPVITGNYEVLISGLTYEIRLNGGIVDSGVLGRGVVTEPAVDTFFCARSNLAIFYTGGFSDAKIDLISPTGNSAYFIMDDNSNVLVDSKGGASATITNYTDNWILV